MKMNKYRDTLARAVDRLEGDDKDRQALYERSRGALIRQIAARNPPLPKTEIIRERLELEEAICLVEAEMMRRRQEARHPKTTAAAPVPIGRLPARQVCRRLKKSPLRGRASSV